MADRACCPRTHYPNFVDLRASGAFAAIAGYDASASVSIGFGSDAYLANAMLVSEEFFVCFGLCLVLAASP